MVHPETSSEKPGIGPPAGAPAASIPGGRPRVTAIVPAHNEESSLDGAIRSLRGCHPGLSILVIDDGSTDRTAEIASSLGVNLLRMPFNVGIGAAVQTGFKWAIRHGFEVAFQFDGDGQHRASEVGRLIAPVLRGEADVAIGSRYIEDSGYPTPHLRRIGMWLFSYVNTLVTGRRFTDNTSGFRAYNRRALAFLAAHYPHDYPEPEAVVLLARAGFRVREVPATMEPRRGGRSSITLLRAVYYMLKVPLAIVVSVFKPPLTPAPAPVETVVSHGFQD